VAPRFFEFLKCEKGLRPATLRLYRHALKLFRAYLDRIGVRELSGLSPVVLSAFVAETCPRYVRSSVRNMCGMLKVFFRHLYVEGAMVVDLSAAIEAPKMYRLSNVPRSITWEEVGRMLASVDRRTAVGRRDYAVLLLLITYGLRAHEVARLTLDDIDWKRERLLVPERKAGHHTAYPLSTLVGQAILEYLQKGRPTTTTDRHVFFRVLAPPQPLTAGAVSCRTSYYLRKAGIPVARPGSHTLRHTCVQRLIDAEFPLKIIGDYVGHSSPESTEIYTKVAIEALREVSLGAGEGII
jgi:integrase/recombinase XerD